MKTIISSIFCIAVLAGCSGTLQDVSALPDSYFTARHPLAYSTQERQEYLRRQNARHLQLDRQAACVFGAKSFIDRTKLNCETVEGSPEYDALNNEN